MFEHTFYVGTHHQLRKIQLPVLESSLDPTATSSKSNSVMSKIFFEFISCLISGKIAFCVLINSLVVGHKYRSSI
jgi:hypothetical protein